MPMDRDRFEESVARAVKALPEEFRERLENIDVVVEDLPTQERLRKAALRQGVTLMDYTRVFHEEDVQSTPEDGQSYR